MNKSLYPPPPCAVCKRRAERVRLPGDRCLSLRLRIEKKLREAPSLDRRQLSKAVEMHRLLKLLLEAKTCAACAEKIASWDE